MNRCFFFLNGILSFRYLLRWLICNGSLVHSGGVIIIPARVLQTAYSGAALHLNRKEMLVMVEVHCFTNSKRDVDARMPRGTET